MQVFKDPKTESAKWNSAIMNFIITLLSMFIILNL